ncbi:hypothetical protein C8R47DRAFT_1256182 [Mycena vitilis]|nr:hypothetical protein C8R47DRAFT_1256182 [Mycena vitilis]
MRGPVVQRVPWSWSWCVGCALSLEYTRIRRAEITERLDASRGTVSSHPLSGIVVSLPPSVPTFSKHITQVPDVSQPLSASFISYLRPQRTRIWCEIAPRWRRACATTVYWCVPEPPPPFARDLVDHGRGHSTICGDCQFLNRGTNRQNVGAKLATTPTVAFPGRNELRPIPPRTGTALANDSPNLPIRREGVRECEADVPGEDVDILEQFYDAAEDHEVVLAMVGLGLDGGRRGEKEWVNAAPSPQETYISSTLLHNSASGSCAFRFGSHPAWRRVKLVPDSGQLARTRYSFGGQFVVEKGRVVATGDRC